MTQKSNWITEFFKWADENHISAEKLPRDEETLLSQTALNLSFCKLTQLPESLANLTHLTELDLAYNALTEIPEWIDNFTALEKLDVSGNSITSLPDSLRHLPNLEVVGLDKQIKKENKKMAQKQDWIDELFAWADENKIPLERLPRIRSSIHKRTILYLDKHRLTTLPESIKHLKNLEFLNLNSNFLTDISSIISMTNLKELHLGDNKLTEIPEFIGRFSNLRILGLGNNQLTKLPECIRQLKRLETLDVSNNPITKIPESILQMPNLKIIGLDKQFTQSKIKTKMKNYQQKILFGSPGTGKSYKIDKQIISNDLKITNSANVIKTVFHPEYTYGDFVGKLMPITVGSNVQYKFYEGHFLKALSQAYKNIIAAQDNDGEIEKVALVIDEINRGNSAAIFGTIFQLLDREPDGWSSYEVSVNEIIFDKLLNSLGIEIEKEGTFKYEKLSHDPKELQEKLQCLNCNFENRTIKIPPNLSILASMNTSDSSIYYMDSAFKRRWEWEFIDVDSSSVSTKGVAFHNRDEWIDFVGELNAFIKSNHKSIRGIEDKQIGHFFITDEQILKSSVQNKLMFFLWDSVFNRDKKPLVKLLFGDDKENELITFGDFAKQVDLLIEKIQTYE